MDIRAVTEELARRYRRYLTTTFHFKDPDLRASFEAALASGPLWKGPYIEATPHYQTGRAPAELFPELLNADPEGAFIASINGNRRLYRHQEEAIRRSAGGRNVVVATGTGSGKTECFLYPILLHLYRAFRSGDLANHPGVRALVLYPMNALAYDQRDRLGAICHDLQENRAKFAFSFGQYIGATPEDERDRYRKPQEVLSHRKSGELVLRREMRERPPHILLTNFSMLEYQLLRPWDSPLFDGAHGRTWSFLVLDEAHQYRGSSGAEMGVLIRRLKQRIRETGHEGPFRCIATSATLANGEADRAQVAAFAEMLFDEPFEAEDVILAQPETPPRIDGEELPAELYAELSAALHRGRSDHVRTANPVVSVETSTERMEDSPNVPEERSLQDIALILSNDARVNKLRTVLDAQVVEADALAEQLFPAVVPGRRTKQLSEFIELLAAAQTRELGKPFVSLRYHFFLRALEGAFVRFTPDKEIMLVPNTGDRGLAFEIALCRECGQHYIVGRVAGERLMEAVRDPSLDDFGVSFFLPLDDNNEGGDFDPQKIMNLCTECGAISPPEHTPSCGHKHFIQIVEQPAAKGHEDRMPSCSICGYRGQDPVQEVIHGGDGPNAMLATALFQWLREETPSHSAKILAFADSRQEAAYFPWYLDQTYDAVLRRSLLWRIVRDVYRDYDDELAPVDVVQALQRHIVDYGLVSEAASRLDRRRTGWLEFYREFLAQEVRLSLAGVGLVRWSVQWPRDLTLPSSLQEPPWSLDEHEARSLLFLLIDSLRQDRAVQLAVEGIDDLPWDALGIEGRQRAARLGAPGADARFVSWNGERGRRVDYLARALRRHGHSKDEASSLAVQLLDSIWKHLCRFSDSQPPNEQLLYRVGDGRRLNPIWWRVLPIGDVEPQYQCDTCRRVEAMSFQGVCTRYRCPGSLTQINPKVLADNHYRTLYESILPGRLVSEEHTAQLAPDYARDIQRRFQQGQINLLSSSTTFELGVDLGDLNTVLLRNVPPEPFNYVQRVGRAGRRAGSPGFAVTYCRRGPHDLYHFFEPERMISGRTQPPAITIDNARIAERHLAATVLSFFFRAHSTRFENVESLIGDWNAPTATSAVLKFVEEHRTPIEASLRGIFPKQLWPELKLDGPGWIEGVLGYDSRLARAEAEIVTDYTRLASIEARARDEGDYKRASWAQRRQKTIAREDVLTFLSRKSIIPKYGFPVDVVELDTSRIDDADRVTLARDLSLAIGEFAPGATLIADKHEWESAGLKTVPERALEVKNYKVCRRHNLLVSWAEDEDEPALPCGDVAFRHRYVIPAFGFVTGGARRAPRRRPERMFTTRPYFLQPAGPTPEEIKIRDDSGSPLATIFKAVPAQMGVLCEGRRSNRFYICLSCGAGFGKPTSSHSSPWGGSCNAALQQLALGHQFITDVVQVEFHPHPKTGNEDDALWLGYGLACALLEGLAEEVGVPVTDLNVTVGRARAGVIPTIVLYDDVPGGAGLVAHMEDATVFRRSIRQALARVSGTCGCGQDASCYGCLRSYRNQFAHPYLRRGSVKAYLEQFVGALSTEGHAAES